jgi:hypothetical protein
MLCNRILVSAVRHCSRDTTANVQGLPTAQNELRMSHTAVKTRTFPLISPITRLSLFALFMLSADMHYIYIVKGCRVLVLIVLLRKTPWLPPRELNESLVNYCTTAILSASSGTGIPVEGRSHHANRQLGYTIILSSG